MSIDLNATHDLARRSWVESANAPDTDFPIQNLPFGVARVRGGAPTGVVALGDQAIDLARLVDNLGGKAHAAARAAMAPSLAGLIAQPADAVSALRAALSDLYAEGSSRALGEAALVPIAACDLVLPVAPRSFADFCCSIDHIRRMAVASGRPVAPCSAYLPVGYNGRASSIVRSGTPVVRPKGQFETRPGSNEVRYGAEPRLDYELEVGVWLRGGNALGETVRVFDAEDSLFGCCLVNDWSARGIQFFESMLGPHAGKSFLTTVSPWIVTMEALAPFRVAARDRLDGEPAVPDHLLDARDRAAGGIRIVLTADLATAEGQSARIATSRFEDMFWTFAQMVAHQASSGAPLEAGDLLASGTVSGPADDACGCLAELTRRGANPVRFADGSERTWLADGDTVTLRGRAQAAGRVAIGFGDCKGTVEEAR